MLSQISVVNCAKSALSRVSFSGVSSKVSDKEADKYRKEFEELKEIFTSTHGSAAEGLDATYFAAKKMVKDHGKDCLKYISSDVGSLLDETV